MIWVALVITAALAVLGMLAALKRNSVGGDLVAALLVYIVVFLACAGLAIAHPEWRQQPNEAAREGETEVGK